MTKSSRANWTRLVLLVVLGLVIAACGSSTVADPDTTAPDTTVPTETTETSGEAPTTTGDSSEPIIIGAAVAQSGGFELYDNEVIKGLNYLIEQYNAEGGILGRPLELIIGDHRTDVAQVASVAEDLISQGADLIVTTADYDFGGLAALQAGELGVLAMGGAGAPEFGFEGLGPLAFNVMPGSQTEAGAMAEIAVELGFSKAYLLQDLSIEYSKQMCDLFADVWPEYGGEIVGVSTFLNSDPSIASQVSEIRAASDAEVLIHCSYPPGGASSLREVRTGGVDLPIVSGVAMDGTFWLEAIPDLSDFHYATMVSSALDDPNEEVNTFLGVVDPAGGALYATFGHAILETYKIAVERAGTTDSEAVAAEIEKFQDEPLMVGPTTYTDECHIPVGRAHAWMEIQNGEPSLVKYVDPEFIPEAAC